MTAALVEVFRALCAGGKPHPGLDLGASQFRCSIDPANPLFARAHGSGLVQTFIMMRFIFGPEISAMHFAALASTDVARTLLDAGAPLDAGHVSLEIFAQVCRMEEVGSLITQHFSCLLSGRHASAGRGAFLGLHCAFVWGRWSASRPKARFLKK